MQKKDLWILAGAICAALILAISQFVRSSVPTGAWGLSFSAAGQPPIGGASVDALKKLDAAYIGDTSQKVLYLTFDAGYENGCTEKILDTLKKHNVPAVFFLVGNYIEKNPDLVRRMANEGHMICNHTARHKDMSQLSDLEMMKEL